MATLGIQRGVFPHVPCKVRIEKHQIKKGIGIQAILEYLGMLKIYKDCTDKFRSPSSSKAEIIINNFFLFSHLQVFTLQQSWQVA